VHDFRALMDYLEFTGVDRIALTGISLGDWFPGNHLLHVSQPDYLRRMTRFMGEFMFR
jgi:hypothetical protein